PHGRLGHLAIGDRRVALLVEHHVARRQPRYLPVQSTKPFAHQLTQVVRHLDVPSPNLNPHELPPCGYRGPIVRLPPAGGKGSPATLEQCPQWTWSRRPCARGRGGN